MDNEKIILHTEGAIEVYAYKRDGSLVSFSVGTGVEYPDEAHKPQALKVWTKVRNVIASPQFNEALDEFAIKYLAKKMGK